MTWKTGNWLVLDTETTGFKKEGGRVYQLALVDVKAQKIGNKSSWLLDPRSDKSKPIEFSDGALRVAKVKPDKLAAHPDLTTFDKIADDVANRMNSAEIVVAYNVEFDKDMLDTEFKAIGKRLPDAVWIDPMVVVRQFSEPPNTLSHAAGKSVVKLTNAHDATADAVAAAEVLINLVGDTSIGSSLPDDLGELSNALKHWHQGWESMKSRREQYLRAVGRVLR